MRALLALVAALLLAGQAFADEAILRFHSDIRIAADGVLEVTETLQVRAEGRQIKRGIYRDFPTRYRNALGGLVKVPFTVLHVTRDGQTERWHTENRDNGVRLYIGVADRLLPPGEYAYAITYRTARQIGFFDRHDEIYWNVTGNEWAFPILHATAHVHLPRNVPADELKLEAYTGYAGDKGRDYAHRVDDGVPVFETTRTLRPQEGLTIVAAFPKGIVSPPPESAQRAQFIEDNLGSVVALIGMLVLLAYYLLVWRAFGKDPQGGAIIPLFEPPRGISPPAARYLAEMGFDDRTFAAAVVDMAVKGYLRIDETSDGDYRLALAPASDKAILAPEERRVADSLSVTANAPLELVQSNHSRIGGARKQLEDALKKKHFKIDFVTNSVYTIPGLVISVGVQAASMLATGDKMAFGALFMMVWLTGWTFGVAMLLRQAAAAWRKVSRSVLHVVPALFVTAFAAPFVAGEIFGLYMFWQFGSWPAVVTLLVLVAINWGFYEWLKAPTLAGRHLYDQLKGFRMYLGTAERDRLNLLHSPERTPELFEKYLPYALALDVENEWAEQFAEVFARAEQAGHGYSPRWYHGTHWDGFSRSSGFASALGGSLAGAIASSSSAPGSSSGSGGGGSSGGGGGGGGGGGW